MKSPYFVSIPLLAAAILPARVAGDQVAVLDRPSTSGKNHFYVGNRPPLEPSRFIALPIGSVKPKGWLLECLRRQRDGLCGNLGKISIWIQKQNNAWLRRDGKGEHGWEELPYWLRGYIQLGYLLGDATIIAESHSWIDGVLNTQRSNGDFGPDWRFKDDGTRDYWPNMVMLFCLQAYYEYTQDARVLRLMTEYFRHQLDVPEDEFLTHYWQKMRGGDNLYSVYWLYNRTGDAWLLQLADKIHRCTANWEKRNDLPDWHNVNIAQGFREPAIRFMQTHDAAQLEAAYANFHEVRRRFGQVPGGMFGGDEICRPGYSDPRQAIETCGMVEQMLSDQLLMQITGDSFWGDHCEDVAFNSYPAAVMPDLRALRYLTAPNMVVSDSKGHAPGIANNGPFFVMNPFSSRCCQHNHGMGWPYFTKHLWLATLDNGLCAAFYSPSEVSAKVADGAMVDVIEETRYPFDEGVRFIFHMDRATAFPLYLRIPGWCEGAIIYINGRRLTAKPEAGKYIRIERQWHNKDTVLLRLPMRISVRRWTANRNSVSINYGPLTFSLKIGERYVPLDPTKVAIFDSRWQATANTSEWPAFEIHPTTPWNYGLVLDASSPEKSFKVRRRASPRDDFPYTLSTVPIELEARAKRMPEWTLDEYGLCGILPVSPVPSDARIERVKLVPMGAARLRISAFPVVADNTPRRSGTEAAMPAGR